MTTALCSSPITGPSSLIQLPPSHHTSSLFSLAVVPTCAFQFASVQWFPQFPQSAHAMLMPSVRRWECCDNRTLDSTNPSHTYRVWFLPQLSVTTLLPTVRFRSSSWQTPRPVIVLDFPYRSRPWLLTTAA